MRSMVLQILRRSFSFHLVSLVTLPQEEGNHFMKLIYSTLETNFKKRADLSAVGMTFLAHVQRVQGGLRRQRTWPADVRVDVVAAELPQYCRLRGRENHRRHQTYGRRPSTLTNALSLSDVPRVVRAR